MTTSATTPLPQDFAQSVIVLLELYKENTTHGRHLETQRQLVTGFVMAIAGTALGALATLKFEDGACFVFGLVLISFGLMGTSVSIVQYGKYTQSRERWRALRRHLDKLCPGANLGTALSEADYVMEKHRAGWNRAGKIPLHWLWTLLNVSILVLGIFLATERYGVGRGFWHALRQAAVAQTTGAKPTDSGK